MPRYRHPPRQAGHTVSPPPPDNTGQATADPILISDLCSEFKVTARTLRFYEENGLLRPRRKGNIRLYSPRDRHKLGLILTLRSAGFGVNEIAPHLKDPPERDGPAQIVLDVEQVRAKLAENRDLLNTAREAVRLLETWLAALEKGEPIPFA